AFAATLPTVEGGAPLRGTQNLVEIGNENPDGADLARPAWQHGQGDGTVAGRTGRAVLRIQGRTRRGHTGVARRRQTAGRSKQRSARRPDGRDAALPGRWRSDAGVRPYPKVGGHRARIVRRRVLSGWSRAAVGSRRQRGVTPS